MSVALDYESEPTTLHIGAQPGPQSAFLATEADVAVYGGQAGAGKSFGLLIDPLRWCVPGPHTQGMDLRRFNGVIFRETLAEVKAEGGLWDEAMLLYPRFGGKPNRVDHNFTFPSGATIGFGYLASDDDRYFWQSTQLAYIGFDQLEHFTWKRFNYLLSRNRSMCGIKPYMRGTCNPKPNWLRTFMQWYIDIDTGLAIPERSGVLRYFVIDHDAVSWFGDYWEAVAFAMNLGDEPEDAQHRVKSFTFIPGSLADNKILTDQDPAYRGKLAALTHVEQQRLLHGNWKIRETAGTFFKAEWFNRVDRAPGCKKVIRYWDRAGTDEENAGPSTSRTAGVKMGITADGRFVVLDVNVFRKNDAGVQAEIVKTAVRDGKDVIVGIEVDPAQAGIAEANIHRNALTAKGFRVWKNTVHDPKGIRARPLAAAAYNTRVDVVDGMWTDEFLDELEGFDPALDEQEDDRQRKRDQRRQLKDQVDAASGAHYYLTSAPKGGSF